MCPSREVTPKRGLGGDRGVYYSVLDQRGLLLGGLRAPLITEGCWSCYQGEPAAAAAPDSYDYLIDSSPWCVLRVTLLLPKTDRGGSRPPLILMTI